MPLKVFISVFLEDIIKGAFRGSGLVPFNPECVLEALNMRLCTLMPPMEEITPWVSKILSNIYKIEA